MAKYYYNKYKADLKGDLLATRSYTTETVVGLFNGIYGLGSVDTGTSLGQTLTYYTHSGNFYGISDYTNYTPSVFLSTLHNYYKNKELYFNILRGNIPVPHGIKVTSTNSVEVYVYNTPAKFTRGALVESNIQAEDGFYPVDGVHSDGGWYVRGALVNTVPTTPGAFTQPTGELEIGDLRTISWGAASDKEGNLAGYTLEVSINGGGYTQIATPSQPTFNYTIPTATSIKFRVKARDSNGLESGYRESATFTVTKPKYYWGKYTVVNEVYEDWGPEQPSASSGGYPNYRREGSSFYAMGPWESYSNGTYPVGRVLYGGSQGANLITRLRFTSSTTAVMLEIWARYREARGSLISSNLIAVEGTYPTNGKHTDGYWYVRGSRVNQSIEPTGGFTLPASGKVFKPSEVATIEFAASSAPNISLYEVDYKYGNGAWQTLVNNASLTRSLTITTDKALVNVQFRVRAKNTSNVYSDYVYSEIYIIEHNTAPTVNLTIPSNNQTLYENETYIIDGIVLDTNVGDTVTVRYQIGAGIERAIKAYLSTGALETFGKQLTFRGGSLYDGETLIASNLVDGIAHTLKVWATDDKGGTSSIVERTFYVVPNRAPLLTVNTPIIEGSIDSDIIQFTGDFSDLDENEVTVQYRINGGNSVQIATGISGAYEFDISFGQLKIGANDVVVEVIDSYGAKTSKTIKLNKNEVESEQLRSTARYKINPPTGSARGVLLWIQRDRNLDIDVAINMTMQGEAESFTPLTVSNTAPLDQGSSIIEDEFYHEANTAKDNVILQIDMERASLEVSDKIYLISGVLD